MIIGRRQGMPSLNTIDSIDIQKRRASYLIVVAVGMSARGVSHRVTRGKLASLPACPSLTDFAPLQLCNQGGAAFQDPLSP